MRLDLFMLADGASAADGKLYIHGGAITRVSPPTLPSPPIILTVVARFLVDVEELGEAAVPLTVTWTRPDGSVRLVGSAEASRDRPEAVPQDEDLGAVMLMNTLITFDVAGRHEVSLRLGDDPDPIAVRGLLVIAPKT